MADWTWQVQVGLIKNTQYQDRRGYQKARQILVSESFVYIYEKAELIFWYNLINLLAVS